jgi:hypothetical protein
MNKPPTGPEFEPEDVDRLIFRFNQSADPNKRRELADTLEGEKEHFKEQERRRDAQERGPDRDR